MDRLRFLLKLAFIFNLCFLFTQLLPYIDYKDKFDGLANYMLIPGIFIAFPLNILVSIGAVIMLILRRTAWAQLPPYVFIINVLILLAQFFFLF